MTMLLLGSSGCSMFSDESDQVKVVVDLPDLTVHNYGKNAVYIEAVDEEVARLVERAPRDIEDMLEVPGGGFVLISIEDVEFYSDSTREISIWWTSSGRSWSSVTVFVSEATREGSNEQQ